MTKQKKYNFKINEKVVYPAHGVGEIIDIETQTIGGTELQVYVINFTKDKMKLRIPVNRAAASGLRPLVSEQQLNKVLNILQSKPKNKKGMWSRKAQEFETKINSGDIELIAEVVRDLHKNVDDPDRSYSERIIYENAFSRLVSELAAIDDISIENAAEKLNDLLRIKEAA